MSNNNKRNKNYLRMKRTDCYGKQNFGSGKPKLHSRGKPFMFYYGVFQPFRFLYCEIIFGNLQKFLTLPKLFYFSKKDSN